jgi:hypothetical protein
VSRIAAACEQSIQVLMVLELSLACLPYLIGRKPWTPEPRQLRMLELTLEKTSELPRLLWDTNEQGCSECCGPAEALPTPSSCMAGDAPGQNTLCKLLVESSQAGSVHSRGAGVGAPAMQLAHKAKMTDVPWQGICMDTIRLLATSVDSC